MGENSFVPLETNELVHRNERVLGALSLDNGELLVKQY
jgi:hypothetical protein